MQKILNNTFVNDDKSNNDNLKSFHTLPSTMSCHSNLNNLTRNTQLKYPSLLNEQYFNLNFVKQKSTKEQKNLQSADALLSQTSNNFFLAKKTTPNVTVKENINGILSTTPLKRLAAGLFGGNNNTTNNIQQSLLNLNNNFNEIKSDKTKILHTKQKPKRSKSVGAVNIINHSVNFNYNNSSATILPHQLLTMAHQVQSNKNNVNLFNYSNTAISNLNNIFNDENNTLIYNNNQQAIDAKFLILAQQKV